MKTSASQEIVLPDGRFARLRPITVRDMLQAVTLQGVEMSIDLAVRCLEIEERAVQRIDVLNLEWSSWICITQLIDRQLVRAMVTKDGVA